ncbi:MAG: hypothetical protein QW816_01690 [Desulfurococcaceae archaeon]
MSIGLSEGVFLLSRLLAILLITVVFIHALFDSKKIRLITSTILVLIGGLHYAVLFSISRYVVITIYPLIIVEHSDAGSAFYLDFGQLSIILLLILWRDRIKPAIKRCSSTGGGYTVNE